MRSSAMADVPMPDTTAEEELDLFGPRPVLQLLSCSTAFGPAPKQVLLCFSCHSFFWFRFEG